MKRYSLWQCGYAYLGNIEYGGVDLVCDDTTENYYYDHREEMPEDALDFLYECSRGYYLLVMDTKLIYDSGNPFEGEPAYSYYECQSYKFRKVPKFIGRLVVWWNKRKLMKEGM